MSFPSRALLVIVAVLACGAGLVSIGSAAASAAVPVPRAPHRLPSAIEPLAPYVPESSCDPHIKRGTSELGRLLLRTYPGTTFASAYACGTDGSPSEHYEGRAIDWMVSVRNQRQHADAKAFLSWLLGTDRAGNQYAMARRLGVMYVIYDNRIWGTWDQRWDPYDNCAHRRARADDNACHRTHIHISLSWDGATGRTTFWTGHVAATDYGPCRSRTLNWAAPRTHVNPTPCAQYAPVRAPKGSSAVEKALVTYSGAALYPGMSGPAVDAVQSALGVDGTGILDRTTRAAVRSFQRRHQLTATGEVGGPTWRSLLRAFAP
jgi:hypothetical protein